jgi:hypothetical protein
LYFLTKCLCFTSKSISSLQRHKLP